MLIGFTIGCVVAVFILPPIAQDPAYHQFADSRKILGIANFYNVISNFPFFILGLLGLYVILKKDKFISSDSAMLTLVIGVIGIGIGSAYYHLNPTNATLVWDRIPMTITFMSFLSIVMGRYVNERWGALILMPLLLIGVASVISWYRSELAGAGDLRLYALVQFYPMIAVPLIIFMFSTPKSIRIKLMGVILFYAIAKIFEHEDVALFNSGEFVSGHTIKHLVASVSVFLILSIVRNETPQLLIRK